MSDGARTVTEPQRNQVHVPSVCVTAEIPGGAQAQATLELRPLVVGSDPACDLVLDDDRVSRRHCEIALTERGILLRDLGSKNGTFAGEIQLLEGIIAPGAQVTLGRSVLTTRVTGPPSTVELSAAARFGEAIGQSVAMRALFAQLERVAGKDDAVLLLGETGTGKEILARAIHDNSPRRRGPYVVLNCSEFAPSMIEAELFGHGKRVFTGVPEARVGLFEQADGGTLFIDELQKLPPELQPRLLRPLDRREFRPMLTNERRQFDARIIAAAHPDLRARMREGMFLPDLYYRVAVVELHVPPLRERRDDIPALVERFLRDRHPPRSLADLPPNALDVFNAYDWPGNVRELQNFVSRVLALGPDAIAQLGLCEGVEPRFAGASVGLPLREARRAFERAYVASMLRMFDNNVTRAADAMGVTRQWVYQLTSEGRGESEGR